MKKVIYIMFSFSLFISCVRLEDIRFTRSNNDLLNLLLFSMISATSEPTIPQVMLVSPTASVIPQQFTLTIRATNAAKVIASYNNTEYQCTYDSATNTWQTPITLDITKNPNEHQITYWAENNAGTQSNHESVTYRWAYHWARRIATDGKTFSNTHDEGVAVVTDSQGNVFWLTYTPCNTNNQVNFAESWGGSDIQSIVNDTSNTHPSITKINADGSYGLTRRICGGFPNNELSASLAVDSADNIYLSGVFFNTLNFADDFGSSDSKTPDGATDIFITKLSNNLTYGYTMIFGTSGNDKFGYNQQGSQNLCTYAGILYFTANFRQDDSGAGVDFNMAKDFNYTDLQSTVRNADAFIVKLEP